MELKGLRISNLLITSLHQPVLDMGFVTARISRITRARKVSARGAPRRLVKYKEIAITLP
jgi:hypothetical protein